VGGVQWTSGEEEGEEMGGGGCKNMLAFIAEEGPEGPESGTEDRAEERVRGARGAALRRTEEEAGEGAGMERRVRGAEVVATDVDVDVVALED
jgi:hypothetical protein